MDIVLNFAIAILAIAYVQFWLLRKPKTKEIPAIDRPTQSKNVVSFNNRIANILQESVKPATQSTDYVARTSIKAIIMDNQAYWITNNAFYTANIVDGHIEENSTRLVDTMTMDKVQLDKMMFIVDKLREEG